MSWGRGVNNNTAGSLRMPSVAQFEEQSKRKKDLKEEMSSTLTVVIEDTDHNSSFVYISDSGAATTEIVTALNKDGRAYVYTHEHPNFLLRVAIRDSVPPGQIVMSEVQAANLHVCSKEPYEWRLFTEWAELAPLEDLTLEVRHRYPVNTLSTVEAIKLNSECCKLLFGLVVTVNELFLVRFEGLELVCRLVQLTPEEQCGDEADELTIPDHYIGIVEAGTRIYLEVDEAVCKSTLIIEGAVSKAAAPPPRDIVNVTTLVDDEVFPVKTKLLRPCLALTSAVQAGKGVHADAVRDVSVNTDCCTFDRVLLFLEAQFKDRPFDILPEHLEDMSNAAEVLKLQPLKDLCDRKRGAFESRVRKDPIPYDEIVSRNARKVGDIDQETLLIMDGMVFDITRWLPEHPGGSTIIPEQALNMDSTVFFEIYHVSRQSFLYLKEFYIGELREDDRVRVPKSPGEPSAGFLEQLKVHTPWRLDLVNNPSVHKSF